ncbi:MULTISPECIES: arylsulfatase [Halomonas]|uniref:arylsulfatase n=1 Tax=Halomonas TaxID=2745 RepID=UPI001C98682B|nr:MULTISPECIES: arylsulfatase [Halomonas]MBY6209104.1 arylsulfatase [Halomonas sp. DP3Y7-2]MBY6229260.1 arylsulfatase [Halomonas sp. DP3Y7-1]MCA0917677.1 arylsulfatase [Halomonas denitrificans]
MNSSVKIFSLIALTASCSTSAETQSDSTGAPGDTSGEKNERPNILVIWGDDIGWSNLSAYEQSVMGYSTPNIDRIGNEGTLFTDHYAQPSCTAGRAAFITGQYPIRSGMTTVGQPGAALGLQAESPSLAEVLKAEGYRTGQFGKNHLGDRNEHLPTVHGFDEFFGNLYHLNTQEEAEQRDYQRFGEAFSGSLEAYEEQFGTRGVLHTVATNEFDDTEMPRFGVVGKQTIEDTGPLTRKRMENFDAEEVIPRAIDFMADASDAGDPFFVWLNTSRMHLYTHLNDEWRYAAEEYTSEADIHGSGMLQHDHDVGMVLDWLDEQGLTDNTIVWYSTDNGPEHSSWPHGGTTPFRGEKMTTYEGGVRVPSMIRWPGEIPSNTVLNGIQGHQDMFTSLAAAAGIDDPADQVMTNKNQYIDGVNNLPYWKGERDQSARDHIFHYYESKLTAIRMGPWKFHFSTKEDYYDNLVPRTVPLVFNLRMDPYESYDSSDSYGHLMQKISWLIQPMSVLMQEHLESLAEYPPVQGGSSFDMSNVVEDFTSKAMQ